MQAAVSRAHANLKQAQLSITQRGSKALAEMKSSSPVNLQKYSSTTCVKFDLM